MLSLTFESLLHLFPEKDRYQEVIQHGLSDFLRAGEETRLHAVADALDRAASVSDQKQAEEEMQKAFQILEQVADWYRVATSEILAETMERTLPDHTSDYYKQRGYYLASLSFSLLSLLSEHLGHKEQSQQAADRAFWTFQMYEEKGMPDDFYLPSSAGPSKGKRKLSTYQQIKKQRVIFYDVLKKWLSVPAVKALIWHYYYK